MKHMCLNPRSMDLTSKEYIYFHRGLASFSHETEKHMETTDNRGGRSNDDRLRANGSWYATEKEYIIFRLLASVDGIMQLTSI